MVLFPFHWTTQFKYLLVAFPHSELLRHFCHSLGAPPVPGCAAEGGTGAVLLSGEALPKKLCMCSARQSWPRAHSCNHFLFLLMDNSLLEMKHETFADNTCPQSTVTVTWTSRMQPVTCSYYQQESYGLIICHLHSQNTGLMPAFIYTGQLCRCWVPPDTRRSHGALVFPGALPDLAGSPTTLFSLCLALQLITFQEPKRK